MMKECYKCNVSGTKIQRIQRNPAYLENLDNPNLSFLVLPGSFNPTHSGHIHILENSKKSLEEEGKVVIGGFILPGHRDFLVRKLGEQEALVNKDRLAITKMEIKANRKSDWLSVDTSIIDLEKPILDVHLMDYVRKISEHLNKSLSKKKIQIYVVCGTDVFMKNFDRFVSDIMENMIGFIVHGRMDFDNGWDKWKKEKGVDFSTLKSVYLIIKRGENQFRDISSTKIRRLIKEGNFEDILKRNWLSQESISYVKKNSLFY